MRKTGAYTNPKHAQRRNAALGKIHIAKKQLDMDDETYRAMLLTIGGVKSSKDLTPEGVNKVVAHLGRSGAVFTKAKKAGRPPRNLNNKAQLKKIEALLAEADRSWRYAEIMAKRMYKKEKLEFCSSEELAGIIAGLTKNAEREGRVTR